MIIYIYHIIASMKVTNFYLTSVTNSLYIASCIAIHLWFLPSALSSFLYMEYSKPLDHYLGIYSSRHISCNSAINCISKFLYLLSKIPLWFHFSPALLLFSIFYRGSYFNKRVTIRSGPILLQLGRQISDNCRWKNRL